MTRLILILVSALLCQTALGAKKEKYWYKVESEKPKQKNKKKPTYPYDSLESEDKKMVFKEIGFWSNETNIGLGGGFYYDREATDQSISDSLFINTQLTFRNRSWHRMMASALIVMNSTMILDASWHYLPSRKRNRSYYGFGIASTLFSEDEFRSILELDNYYVTGVYGIEFLTSKRRGFRVEGKAYLGSGGSILMHVLASYIFHL
ncbi:MAG: hypothetical protein HRT44_08015 [Bdellovibrionales bacterium]|nr:hypothetical protein [Bdellovibrionales bacterium]NQZ19184.1 hypothetical protein [Bdellovibrionales bacterium]